MVGSDEEESVPCKDDVNINSMVSANMELPLLKTMSN